MSTSTGTRLAAALLAMASVIALSGCVAHPGAAPRGTPTRGSVALDAAVDAGVRLPGDVVGTDGQGETLVKLSSSTSSTSGSSGTTGTSRQPSASGTFAGYGLFDASGKEVSWTTPSPVADAETVELTTAGLFAVGAAPIGVSRVDSSTGAVLWTVGAEQDDSTGLYSLDDDWHDSGIGGDLVILSHIYESDDAAHTEHHELVAFDAASGARRFAIPSDNGDLVDFPHTITHDVRVLSMAPLITAKFNGTGYDSAESRDPDTGSVTASLDPTWFTENHVETTGTLFVTRVADSAKPGHAKPSRPEIVARNARGKTVWTHTMPARRADIISVDARTVLVQSDDGTITALDAASGAARGAYSDPSGGSGVGSITLVAPGAMAVSAADSSTTAVVPLPDTKNDVKKKS